MSDPSMDPVDVVIVGAGLAGAAAAHALGGQGRRVVLLDARETCAPCFKAEKIESDQADLLRRLGLFDVITERGSRVHEVLCARGDRALSTVRLEQYGVFYHDMVNAVRRALPAAVERRVARVSDVWLGPELQRVTCQGGEQIAARLVILAAGTSDGLRARLGLERRMVSERHSLALGFDVEAATGRAGFDAITYFRGDVEGSLDYVTLFPIGEKTRANVFLYRATDDAWVRRFAEAPDRMLSECFPGLARFSGDLRVSSKVQAYPIDLYTTVGHRQPGMVIIGDAFQSVCPATGTGLSKLLTDVEILTSECVPEWMETPYMDAAKIAQFYEHPRKVATDLRSLQRALYRRRVSTDTSLPWRLRREHGYLKMRAEGWRARWDELYAGLRTSFA